LRKAELGRARELKEGGRRRDARGHVWNVVLKVLKVRGGLLNWRGFFFGSGRGQTDLSCGTIEVFLCCVCVLLSFVFPSEVFGLSSLGLLRG